MIHGLVIVTFFAIGYAIYKHLTVAEIKAIVKKYEASATAEVKNLVVELKSKL